MWSRVLGVYCERGADPAFWAEPLNALSNAGFVLAGAALILGLRRAAERDRRALSWVLAALVVVIGVGSFLFHTFATRWAGAMDVLPILAFILTAIYALATRAFGAPVWAALLALPAYFGLILAVRFAAPLVGVPGGPVLYLPALLVLLGSGAALAALGRPTGRALLAAGAVFAVSLTLRTLDRPFCAWTTFGETAIGLHFLWHLLNAVTLYLVARALIRAEPPPAPLRAAGSTGAARTA